MSLFGTQNSRLRRKTERRLETHKSPGVNFYTLIGFASALATLGLLLDNAAVVIGAMLVAPLVTPVFGFSLSLMVLRVRRMFRSLVAIILGTFLAVVVSAIMGFFARVVQPDMVELTGEIVARAEPNLLFFFVALFSGGAGAYAYARPKLHASITGIAISVAIIPPLAVSGLGLALQEWFIFEQSLLLYAFNLVGICFGSIVMFFILGFGKDIEA